MRYLKQKPAAKIGCNRLKKPPSSCVYNGNPKIKHICIYSSALYNKEPVDIQTSFFCCAVVSLVLIQIGSQLIGTEAVSLCTYFKALKSLENHQVLGKVRTACIRLLSGSVGWRFSYLFAFSIIVFFSRHLRVSRALIVSKKGMSLP